MNQRSIRRYPVASTVHTTATFNVFMLKAKLLVLPVSFNGIAFPTCPFTCFSKPRHQSDAGGFVCHIHAQVFVTGKCGLCLATWRWRWWGTPTRTSSTGFKRVGIFTGTGQIDGCPGLGYQGPRCPGGRADKSLGHLSG
jgi:hypothetical protein